MKVEFINFNDDPQLDPEIKPIRLSQDSKNMPPAYCLPWVQASLYSIQIKSNFDYWIRKNSKGPIEACAMKDGKILPIQDIYAQMPAGVNFIPKNEDEKKSNKIHLSRSPAFSGPWQKKQAHSITLKLGISWWTPPGWGLFICSAVHRNEALRVIEGYVRTDLWHRDIPIIIQPISQEVKIAKYSILASALLVKAEELELVKSTDQGKMQDLANNISQKRLSHDIYKRMVLKNAYEEG